METKLNLSILILVISSKMIDPRNITNYNRNKYELEEFAVFSVLVAGKTAKFIAKALEKFISGKPSNLSLFQYIQMLSLEELAGTLYSVGVGCHSGKSRTLKELVSLKLDLNQCSKAELMTIWGIGDKTANFFILHSRPNQFCGAIDTHIQKYLKMSLKDYSYAEIEEEFLKHVAQSGKTAAELDLEIWNRYARQ